MIENRLNAARAVLKKNNIDAYVIPTSDFHQSENVSDFFKARTYFTGFTGSAGTLVISQEEACLWVDGRYHIQVDHQVPSCITVMKMGLPNVPTIHQYLTKFQDGVLGFDGRVVNTMDALAFPVEKKVTDIDLPNLVWTDRPTLSCNRAFLYDLVHCGESRVDKIIEVRDELGEFDAHIITSLDDIAWIFNIRGCDIENTPVVLSYAMITKTKAYLYIQDNTLTKDELSKLSDDGVIVKPYNSIYEDVTTLKGTIILDQSTVNYQLYRSIPTTCTIVDQQNPSQLLKAIKNPIEIQNTIQAHIKDGVAMSEFMYWLKNEMIESNEYDIGEKLGTYRLAQKDCTDMSFGVICGYQENAALMHYSASKDECSTVTKEGLLLIDSGGQYLDGTTDITRTFCLGPITANQRRDFTIVLKALLRLSAAKFPAGTTGQQLDILARGVVYNYDLDYRCGTGHGVGHFLSVHEGPNDIRPKTRPGCNPCAFVPGMITTNEPGIYKENEYGIRLENELLCVEDTNTPYGQFLSFQTITMCPFDVDAIDYSMLTSEELAQLNAYHVQVYTTLKPYLSKDTKEWLKEFINKYSPCM